VSASVWGEVDVPDWAKSTGGPYGGERVLGGCVVYNTAGLGCVPACLPVGSCNFSA
jgi:hypothetical protein